MSTASYSPRSRNEDARQDITTINGTDGDDKISATEAAEEISVGNGNDVVDAGDGNDTVFAGAGSDTVSGGSGNDTIYGDSGQVFVTGPKEIKDDAPLKITFNFEEAGYRNSFGYYKIDPDTGALTDVHIIWENALLQGSGGNLIGNVSAGNDVMWGGDAGRDGATDIFVFAPVSGEDWITAAGKIWLLGVEADTLQSDTWIL